MRIDPETGNQVPSTLGEYLMLCRAIGGDCDAVRFLTAKIAESSEHAVVAASDDQMRRILMPMLTTRGGEPIA